MSPFPFRRYLQQSELQQSDWQQLAEQHADCAGAAHAAVAVIHEITNTTRVKTFFIQISY